jgi:hypothetical protein
MGYEWSYKLNGFSVLPRRPIFDSTPITVSKTIEASEEYVSSYEIVESVTPVVGPWRINNPQTFEGILQTFSLDTEHIALSGDYATTTTSAGVGEGNLSLGLLLYTYDDTDTHQPWTYATVAYYSTLAKQQGLLMYHNVGQLTPPSSTSGYNPFTYDGYTVKYPGLISQIGLVWYWTVDTYTADYEITLEATISDVWLNTMGTRSM